MPHNYIDEYWREYIEKYPKLPETVYRELRDAFFAGAVSILTILHKTAPQYAELAMKDIDKEVGCYIEELKKRVPNGAYTGS